MKELHKIELTSILPELPDIVSLNFKQDLSGREDEIFICALGFEERCIWLPEQIADLGDYRSNNAIYFEYATNVADNELNKPRLIQALERFGDSVRPLPCDEDEFPNRLREHLGAICEKSLSPQIVFDVSACSSKVVLLTLKVLLEFNVELRLLYSEAGVYHPTLEEYEEDPVKWTSEEGFGIAKGVGKVIPSPEHPGYRRDRLPEVVIAFPTFKPERTLAVITEVDESLITRPRDRVVWIVSMPHLEEDSWRADIMRDINSISDDKQSFTVSTFDYKDTVKVLEHIYKLNYCAYHLTISPLGSKLQSIGIAVFAYLRQDVSLVFAMPQEYNASQYTEGCKAVWQINFRDLKQIRNSLDRVDQIEIVSKPNLADGHLDKPENNKNHE